MQEKVFLSRNPHGFHRVAYAEWGAASARPPVLCVHGLTRNGRDFDTLARALKNERQLFCPDIAGRGKSDWLDPVCYHYPQYLADMVAMIARTGAAAVDWVGTSMGGIIGMLLASEANAPIRKLVVNDVGPFIPVAALKRIREYASAIPEFSNEREAEKYMRQIYGSFGNLSDEQWHHLAAHGTRKVPGGRLALAYDPAIGEAFGKVDRDVDFWQAYDRIRCPVLLLRGAKSDILPAEVAEEMTRRGPRAKLVEFPKIGHAPALMDPVQIDIIAEFLQT
jgi:pimeloyl-ACP methyl ester carboxylesterase